MGSAVCEARTYRAVCYVKGVVVKKYQSLGNELVLQSARELIQLRKKPYDYEVTLQTKEVEK